MSSYDRFKIWVLSKDLPHDDLIWIRHWRAQNSRAVAKDVKSWIKEVFQDIDILLKDNFFLDFTKMFISFYSEKIKSR